MSGYLYPAEKMANPEGVVVIRIEGEGEHLVEGWLRPSRLEQIANAISLLGLVLFIIIYFSYAQKKEKETK